MQIYIKTNGEVEITLNRDLFDALRGMIEDFSVDHKDIVEEVPEVKEVVEFIVDDDNYCYQVTEEIHEATESFISGLVDYYKNSEGVNEDLIRQIIAIVVDKVDG